MDPTRQVEANGGSPPEGGGTDAGDLAVPTPPGGDARPSAEGGDAQGSAGAGGPAPPRPARPWSSSAVLASAAGEEGGPPSFGDLIRHHGRLVRERGKVEQALGRLTVERDALQRRLDALAASPSAPDPVAEAPPEATPSRRSRWLAPTLLGLLLLAAIAWWALGWPIPALPWEGGGGGSTEPAAPSVTVDG